MKNGALASFCSLCFLLFAPSFVPLFSPMTQSRPLLAHNNANKRVVVDVVEKGLFEWPNKCPFSSTHNTMEPTGCPRGPLSRRSHRQSWKRGAPQQPHRPCQPHTTIHRNAHIRIMMLTRTGKIRERTHRMSWSSPKSLHNP